MNLIIRKARILHPGSPHHLQVKDLKIVNGHLEAVADDLPASGAQEIVAEQLHISLGWVDLQAYFFDPGFEQRERIVSGLNTAMAGGYTHVAVMPNTEPVTETKSQVEYLLKMAQGHPVQLIPVGAVSHGLHGIDLAEMQDMHQAGVPAFSDGLSGIQSAGLLERALRYSKSFDTWIIDRPQDATLAAAGMVHESALSDHWGLPGIPDTAETVMVNRNLLLQEYTGGNLHLLDVSSAASLDAIRKAQQRTKQVSASVSVNHLVFEESRVHPFQTAFKFNPPLRSEENRKALLQALLDGTLSIVTSQHLPLESDLKHCEFDKAGYGSIGLQTVYSMLNSLPELHSRQDVIVRAIALEPRRILQLPVKAFEPGMAADFTLFQPDAEWEYQSHLNPSQSSNAPLLGSKLKGKVLGVLHKNYLHLNSY